MYPIPYLENLQLDENNGNSELEQSIKQKDFKVSLFNSSLNNAFKNKKDLLEMLIK